MLPGRSQAPGQCSRHTWERWTPLPQPLTVHSTPVSCQCHPEKLLNLPTSPHVHHHQPSPISHPDCSGNLLLNWSPQQTGQCQWGPSTRSRELTANTQEFGEKGG